MATNTESPLPASSGLLTSSLFKAVRYYTYGFWEEYGDPRVSHLPLLHGGPWKIVLISLLYVAFVKLIGPRFMKNRKAYDLRPLMLLHNGFLIGVNGCGFVLGMWVTNYGIDTWKCQKLNPDNPEVKETLAICLGYIYLLTKIVDFADTIFFVFRKKYGHISFLHVFHHAVMPIITAICFKFYPAGYSGFLPIVNIFVHTVMYSYYALACVGGEMRQFLWWKKYITQMQIVQFVMVFFHGLKAMIIPGCWPFVLAAAEAVHALIFLQMFLTFYKRAYWDQPSPPVKAINKQDKAVKRKSHKAQ